jgi:deoxyribonuclease V
MRDLRPVDLAVARTPVTFPYIPGLLSFRELPVLLRALEQLHVVPDVFIVDGHGRAHPRRMGIACHLGVLLDLPAIGCAKSILCGTASLPANRAGAWSPLVDGTEQVGAALRTRDGTTPVYVSIGHRVSLDSAIEVVLKCCRRYRLPETTRYAHRAADGQRVDLSPSPKSFF